MLCLAYKRKWKKRKIKEMKVEGKDNNREWEKN
jgi:hypothetical protein